MRCLLGLLCLVGTLALPARAQALEGQPASPVEVAAAQALFEQGRALMAQGRAEDACPKFEESQRLDPALGTQFNLANCHEQLGRLASAYTLFTQVAATARATGQQQRETVAQARADALKPRLPKLEIQAPAGSAGKLTIVRDGMLIGEAEWGLALPVDPGLHRVQAFGPGVGEWALDIAIPSDGAVHRVLVPGPADEKNGFLAPLNHKLALASAGVGVVGLGTAVFFASKALARKHAADAAGCRGTTCPTEHGVDLRSSAIRAGDAATLGLGIGAAGFAGAAALLWLFPELGGPRNGRGTSFELTPLAARGTGAASLTGHF